MKLSVVVSTHQASFAAVAFKGNLRESLISVAEAGYDGAELAVRNAAEVETSLVKETCAELGLAVPAIGTGQMWGEEKLSLTAESADVRRETVRRIGEHVGLAAALGAQVIIGLVRGVFPRPELMDESYRWLEAGLREVCAAAEDAGVRIALEAINRYETAYVNSVADGLELVERVGSPAFGLLLDTFHMNIEDASMVEAIHRAGSRVFHFHVADSNRWFPGAGHINFAALLRALRDVGYDGYISGEFLPKPDGPTSIRRGIATIRPMIEALDVAPR